MKIKILFAFMAVIFFVGCKSEPIVESHPELMMDLNKVSLGPEIGDVISLTGTTNVDWSVKIEEGDFFDVNPKSGTAGEINIELVVIKENENIEPVQGLITMNGEGLPSVEIEVLQLKAAAKLAVSPAQFPEFPSEGGEVSVLVNSNMPWTSVSDADWLQITPYNGDAGEKNVKVLAQKNEELNPRSCNVLFSIPSTDQEIELTFTQAASQAQLTVSLNEILDLNGTGESRDFTITSSVDWSITVDDGADWFKVEPSSGVASKDAQTITLTVAPNSSSTEERIGSLTIIGIGLENQPQKVKISQSVGINTDAQIEALQAMETTLEGDATEVLNWSNIAEVDTWKGVVLDAHNNVSGLNLAGLGLNGVIPSDIIKLELLETLDLSNNNLTGNIPAEIGSLAKLTTFKVSMNKLEGIVPPDVINVTYGSWDAMKNVYPQQGSTDVSKPAKLALKLNDIGILRCLYYTCDGENWVNSVDGTPIVKPAWLTSSEPLQKVADNPSYVGIGRLNSLGQLQAFGGVGGMTGVLDAELAMLTSFAQFRAGSSVATKNTFSKINLVALQNFKYLHLQRTGIVANLNEIFKSVNKAFVELKFEFNNITVNDGEAIDWSIVSTFTTTNFSFHISNNKDLKGILTPEDEAILKVSTVFSEEGIIDSQILSGTQIVRSE